MNELAPLNDSTLLNLVTGGDCSKLSNEQKLQYYKARCDAAGLDPRTKPFDIIKLQGREVLYATKECSNQLASKHCVKCEVISQSTENDIRTVLVRATSKDGRQTDEIGCVTVGGLKGDALCNAYMKAITKAKRRAILSICGLGMTDESELDTIPAVSVVSPEPLKLPEVSKVGGDLEPAPKTVSAKEKANGRYLNGAWKTVAIHFGKNKGKKLGELEKKTLRWYRDEWKPQPFNGTLSPNDVELRAALDAYKLEREEEKALEAAHDHKEEVKAEPEMAEQDISW